MNKNEEIAKLKIALMQKIKKENDIRYNSLSSDEIIKTIFNSSDNGKYSLWIIREYLKENIQRFEDIESRCKQALTLFRNNLNKFDNSQKQLNKLSFQELETLVEPYQDILTQNAIKRMSKEKIWAEIEIIYEGIEGRIYVPKTKEAAIFLGQGTKWCTAAVNNNMFDHYNEKGSIYVFILPEKDEKGREIKYQLHWQTNQFMDMQDKAVNLNICEKLLNILFNVFTCEEKVKLSITSDLFFEFFSDKPEIKMINKDIWIEQVKFKKERFFRTVPDLSKMPDDVIFLYAKHNIFTLTNFETIPERLRTEELYKILVSANSGYFWETVPEKFKTKELCEIAVKQNGKILREIPEKFKTYELCELAVQQNDCAIKYVPENMITEDLCELSIIINPYNINIIPDKYKTKDFFKKILYKDGLILKYIPNIFCEKDITEILKFAVANNPEYLRFIPEKFINSEIIEIAVENNANPLLTTEKKIITEKLCWECVSKEPLSLRYVPKEFKTQELYELAVQGDETAFQYVPSGQRTKELCEIAVKKYGWALGIVPGYIKTQELCELAVSSDPFSFYFVPDEFKTKKLSDMFIENFMSKHDLKFSNDEFVEMAFDFEKNPVNSVFNDYKEKYSINFKKSIKNRYLEHKICVLSKKIN